MAGANVRSRKCSCQAELSLRSRKLSRSLGIAFSRSRAKSLANLFFVTITAVRPVAPAES